MDFEYDHGKSTQNLQKHGISFEEAKALWVVPALTLEGKNIEEVRFIRIGRLKGKFYSCIYTLRGEKIRLISARRSRSEEEELYQKEKIEDEENKEN